MKLTTKKYVFTGLALITIGATVGGVFMTPIFALAGTSLVGTIAVGKMIVGHRKNQEHKNAPVNPELTPDPKSNEMSVGPIHSKKPSNELSHVEEKKEDINLPEAPELERQFSMHVMYKSHNTSPGGTISPDSINVTVHTHPQHERGHSQEPSPLKLTRKLSTTEGF